MTKIKEKVMQMFHMKRSVGEIVHFIAGWMVDEYKFKTVSGTKHDEIYVYDEGIYCKKGRDVVRGECEKMLGSFAKTHLISEIINKVVRMTLVNGMELGINNLNLLCLRNGVYDVKKKVLLPHDSKYGFVAKLPLVFDKRARCPKISEFLESVLYDAEDVKGMEEWLGLLLWREYYGKKAGIFLGGTDTGKTTMLNLVTEFIGMDNISGVSLQQLAKDKFAKARLYKKMVNVCDELSEKDVDDVDTFKMVTGKSPIDGEYKFGDKFSFVNYAKLMFATNKSPNIKTNAEDAAYYNRWLIWKFDNVFGREDKDTNPNILKEITTEREMSGLLNLALMGLERLKKMGRFSNDKDALIVKLVLQRDSTPMAAFAQDMLIKDVGKWVSKKMLYDKFVEYCGWNDLAVCTMDMFGKSIRGYCSYLENGRQGVVNGWRNAVFDEKLGIFGIK